MTEVQKDNLPAATDAPRVDGFAGYEDGVEGDEQESSNRVIQGELIKFSNGSEWIGRDDAELSSELELIVIDILRIVQKWVDGNPVETIILEPGQRFPNIEDLNAQVPKEEWREGPDGRPRGPWQAQHVVRMLNPADMTRYSYPTGTVGGAIAVRDLVDRTNWMRKFRGEHVYPVVTLADTYMRTRFGGRQRPHFDIKRWVAAPGDGDRALPPPGTPRLAGPKEVTEPSAKEVTGDSIEY